MNISIIEKNDCTGCFACMEVCPKECIKMDTDEEKFNYPKVDLNKCVNCGLCLKSCPVHSPIQLVENIKAYAAIGKNSKMIESSSSGGAFIVCAQYVINELNGYVCGAILDENLILKHKVVNSMSDVRKMQGSKYIQSELGNCFQTISSLLKEGNYVLFSGTPCQVAGLRQTVKSHSDHLYTLDLICHGVPSALAFKDYLYKMYGEKKYYNLTFRQKNKYLLQSYALCYNVENTRNSILGNKFKRIEAFEDPFYHSFCTGINYRESCYHCKYASSKRCGDITIGDCANSNSYQSLLGRTLSSIIINTNQGISLWNEVKSQFIYVPADYEEEVRLNKQLHEPVKRPARRNEFYKDLKIMENKDFKNNYCPKRNVKDRIKHFIIWHIPAVKRIKLKKLLGVFNV